MKKSFRSKALVSIVIGNLILSNGAYAIQTKDVIRVENAYKSRNKYVRGVEIKDPKNISQNISNVFSYNPKLNIKTISLSPSKTLKGKYDIELIYRESNTELAESKKLASRLAQETAGMNSLDIIMYLTQSISLLTEYNDQDIDNPLNYSPYGIVQGKAVCQGYTYFLEMVLNELGIANSKNYVTSEGQPHIYNTINMGGNNYGIDITQADMDNIGKVDWGKVLFNRDREIDNIGTFNPIKTSTPLSTVKHPMPDVVGLVSIKDGKIYSDTDKGLVGFNYKTNQMTFEFAKDYYEDFYVIGDDLLILTTGGDLINKGQKILATNVKSEDIIYNHSVLYVNGEEKYRSTTLPSDKSMKVGKQFKVNLDNRHTQQDMWEGISVFQGNKFIMEFTQR